MGRIIESDRGVLDIIAERMTQWIIMHTSGKGRRTAKFGNANRRIGCRPA